MIGANHRIVEAQSFLSYSILEYILESVILVIRIMYYIFLKITIYIPGRSFLQKRTVIEAAQLGWS